jgi:hypothetical protein
MDSLTPHMQPEAVTIPGAISGRSIIADLCRRIAERLSGDCNLRPSDCYTGYSFQAVVTIQLHDVYACEIATVVEAGRIDPQQPALRIDLGSQVVAEPEDNNLERPVDPSGVAEMPVKEKGIRSHR